VPKLKRQGCPGETVDKKPCDSDNSTLYAGKERKIVNKRNAVKVVG